MIASNRIWTRGNLSFWSWNDKLDKTEIARQLREFKTVGIHGVFIHARGGLQTPYMGEEWMDAVESAIEEAKRMDMEIWLYDEDAWPSGFCGGKVPSEGERYQQKWLCHEAVDSERLQLTDRSLACYIWDATDGRWQQIPMETGVNEQSQVLHVYYDTNPYYTDLLDPDAVACFIGHTHEKYKERFGQEFGRTIRGVFTDEPQYAVGKWPWSPALAATFEAVRGYGLLSILPALWFDQEGSTKAKHDYWHAVTRQFVSSFTAQIGLWCEKNGLCFTGHMAAEDTLSFQISQIGAAMPHYEWMQMPGIDHLGLRLTRPVLIKQAASVARQLGRKQVLAETFGCSGWGADFKDLKWITDWQLALGVNVQCQHLASYSLRGARKRDYPPSLSWHQPWWRDFDLFNQYVTNRQNALTSGTAAANILIIHPISSAWCLYDPDRLHSVRELDRRFGDLSQLLLDMQREFDYGDEMLLSKYGVVEQGWLKLGESRYGLVILPALFSLEKSTFELLKRFAAQGGKVISAGDYPKCIEGVTSKEMQEWCDEHVEQMMPTYKTFERALAGVPSTYRLADARGRQVKDVIAHHRMAEHEETLFLFHSQRDNAYRNMSLSWDGAYEVWTVDAISGERINCSVTMEEGRTLHTFTLRPGESVLFIARRKREALAMPATNRKPEFLRSSFELGGTWRLAKQYMNALTLDRCRYRIAGEEAWSDPYDVLHLQELLAARRERLDIEMEFSFAVQSDYEPKQALFLAGEELRSCSLSVNGQAISGRMGGEWLDPSIEKIEISPYVRCGRNSIVVRRPFEGRMEHRYLDDAGAFETERNRFVHKTELESMYLLGYFETAAENTVTAYSSPKGIVEVSAKTFVIRSQSTEYLIEELTSQGLHFFQGTVSLEKEFMWDGSGKRAILRLMEPASCVIRVDVNGMNAGRIAWEPYEWDLSDTMKVGVNTITFHLTGTLRNLLGPHHHYMGDPFFVGPSTFKGRRGWEDALTGYAHPEVMWRERYGFVPFGTGHSPVLEILREIRD
ncbi:glycosyl hydrolase [Cohnella sp. WQ 127256]|uniref:glycosyl hydrolase n=1 Tax=Cohnella sp. WQ 127256 TaxID=2938790 RepID=UPI002118E7BB|nr:glycosyl hydrolase [Cohnella sp. WQ 127256]